MVFISIITKVNSILRKTRLLNHTRVLFKTHYINKCYFGGYIEDAQLTLYGIEVYKDIYGIHAMIPSTYIIPSDNEQWPYILWNYELGKGITTHIISSNNNDLKKK